MNPFNVMEHAFTRVEILAAEWFVLPGLVGAVVNVVLLNLMGTQLCFSIPVFI